MDFAGNNQEFDSPSAEAFESVYEDTDVVGVSSAGALMERVNEIDALAQVASECAKRAVELEAQDREALAAGQPRELLAAEILEASERYGAIMSTLLTIIYPDIHEVALRQTRSHVADAKDLAQDAAKRILTAMHTYTDRPGGFRPWYVTVVCNVWKAKFRKMGKYLSKIKMFFRLIPDEQTRIREQMERLEVIQLFRTTLKLMSEDCVERVNNLEPRGSRVGGHEDIAKNLKENLAASVKRTRKCLEEFKLKYTKLYRGDRPSSLERV